MTIKRTKNPRIFKKNLEKWAKHKKVTLDEAVELLVVEISSDIIQSTPVDTGRARGNWQASNGTPILNSVDTLDKTGVLSIGKVAGVAVNSAGNIYHLTNNLPYITKLEYGSSNQNPEGMVRINLKNFEYYLRYGAFNKKIKQKTP